MSNAAKDIDDVDDDLFISRKRQDYIFAEKKAQDLTEKTKQSMVNSRAMIQESEQVGLNALENLSVQREALERVEDDLDSINTMTRATQKHLNNMKSFFGGIKSLFSSSNSSTSNAIPPTVPSTRGSAMPRSQTLTNVPSSVPASSSSSNTNSLSTRGSFATPAAPKTVPAEGEDEFEANLSEIGFGLGRLKEMALQLGDGIGDQNDMLDRIRDKSERAGDSVKHQHRQIQQLLKKS